MNEKKNVPQLRFPEFNEPWEYKKVSTLLERIVNPVNVVKDELYQQIGIRSHGKGIFYKESVTGQELGNKRVFWIKEDVFIVNIVFAWEQAVAITTKNEIGMIASHRFPMYKPIENQSYLFYILHFFLTKRGKELLELASPGGAGRNKTLGQKEFEKLKFLIPPLQEQTKIADFLTSVDKKIELLTKKKELIEKYKKGLMQKIFSQEIRFKDDNGNDYPDWEEKKFTENIISLPTKKYQLISQNILKNGSYPVIDQGRDKIAGYSNNKELLFKNYPVIVFGDHTTILKYIDFDFILGADGTKLLKNKSKDDLKYIFYNLNHNSIIPEGYKRHYSILSEINLQIPNLPE